MQLYARENNKTICADEAQKRKDYHCLHCGNIVRLRAGRFRQKHFYHFGGKKKRCLVSKRSLEHLHLQGVIVKHLPPGEGALEVPFPTIGRVADVVWEKQKLVFEVQCSMIPLLEVRARERDYANEGYVVIWILSDRVFNKWWVTPTERYIRTRGGYYAEKRGDGIYDQYDWICKGRRRFRIFHVSVFLGCPHLNFSLGFSLPPGLATRQLGCKYYFQGDLVDRCLSSQAFVQKLALAHDSVLSYTPLSLFRKLWDRYLTKCLR